MKTLILCLAFLTLLFSGNIRAQEISVITFPSLQVQETDKNTKEILLDELDVKVKVVGNLVTTTFEMRFLNKNNRVMEGELIFPLSEDASITRFAMDVNGAIREGVPVEKNKGQQVFETIERRQVDPGLLEHVQGNTFKTRVYPIPARGYKTVIVAFSQELQSSLDKNLYALPLYFGKEVGKFSLQVEVFKQEAPPVLIDNNFEDFQFDSWNENYKATARYEDILLNHQLKFALPKTQNHIGVFTEKGAKSDDNYFYIVTEINEENRMKKLPDFVSVFWDVSGSSEDRKIKEELILLKEYFDKISKGNAELFLFSNTLENAGTFEINNGKCEELFSILENSKYDGGTQLSVIDFNRAKGKEILLFSDGMGTFGDNSLQPPEKPVIVINSNSKADHALLNYLAIASAGTYINLQKKSATKGIQDMTNEPLRLISIKHDNSISEVYPSLPVKVSNTFSCSGKLLKGNGSLSLNFGYNMEIIKTIDINLDDNSLQSDGMLEKVWANKKLWELNLQYEKNKEKIREIGKKHSIVTPNTSLIVLETVEDYVEFNIEPPKHLFKEFNELLHQKEKEAAAEKQEAIERTVILYQNKINWWKRDFSPVELPEPKPVAESSQVINPIEDREYSLETKLFSGIVTDEDGVPLIGATVVLKNSQTGITTDVDGTFSLHIPINGILQCIYVGYQTVEIDANGISSAEISLPIELGSLEEVIVTGYGVLRSAPIQGMIVEAESDEDMLFMVAEGNLKSKKAASQTVGSIYLKPWDPDTPYLKELKKYEREDLYTQYLKIRADYKDIPSFFTDVSNLLYEKGLTKQAVRVLSNLSEIELSSHELLRVLAHKLEQMKQYDPAIEAYKKVLELRKEEPQSYRDLALVYAKNGQYQKAVDLLWVAINIHWDGRFPGIEVIMVTEMNSIIAEAGKQLETSEIDSRLLFNLAVDIRVVLNWDADNTDMDLWVTDPNGEKCFYSHKETRIGGLMSNDFTGGYGPEEFMLKKAINGNYRVAANYYGSSQQKIAGPVTIYLEFYLNYGKPDQELKEIVLRLSDRKEVIEIGDFEFKQ